VAYTEAQLQTLIGEVIHLLEAGRQFGNANTPNIITVGNAANALAQDGRADEFTAGIRAYRNGMSALISPDFGRQMLDPLLVELARVKSYPERDPASVLRRLAKAYNASGTDDILSRQITFGPVSPGGSNIGNGTIRRLTVTPYDEPIETTHAEVKTFTCIRDLQDGVKSGQEQFRYDGTDRLQDNLLIQGSGISNRIVTARNGADTKRYLKNPSFSGNDSGSAPSNWTDGPGNSIVDTTTTYRTYQGEGTAGALKVALTGTVSQLLSVRGGKFEPDVPYYVQIAWNPTTYSAPDGTVFSVALGSQTLLTVTKAGETNWNVAPCTLDKKLYYQNWAENAPSLDIVVSTLASGAILFDDVILCPMERIDGVWCIPVGGSTPFLGGGIDKGDTFSFDDSTEVGAVLSYWLWQLYGDAHMLPVKTAVPDWAEPLAWA